MGEFGGWAHVRNFKAYIKPSDKIIDFGCGGGYLLKQLNCAEKIGIEINEIARHVAAGNGINTVPSANDVADSWADVIISSHALEHTAQPLNEIILLKEKLRSGGLMVFVVPSEGVFSSFNPEDPNHHLYTWSPMNLGNLFKETGFIVLESKAIFHRWPPKFKLIAKMGKTVFDICCHIYGFLQSPKFSQSRVVARKP